MNIETWGYIRHLFFVEQSPKKAIARKLNLAPKTVRMALVKETFSRCHSGQRPSKLDPFMEKIKELLHCFPGMSAVRINEKIREKGYDGGISILRSYLRTVRTDQKTGLSNQILTGAGAQAYWSYAARIGERASYCFLMVLSFSKMLFIEFFPSRSLENLLTGHLHAFHYFQGIPPNIHYNFKNIILNIPGSNTQFNRKFLDFAACHLFTPHGYNVRNLHEKRRVEIDAYYVRNKFLAGRTFDSFIDCNHQVILWLDTIANIRFHRTVKARIIDLFKGKEQPHMIPLLKPEKNPKYPNLL